MNAESNDDYLFLSQREVDAEQVFAITNYLSQRSAEDQDLPQLFDEAMGYLSQRERDVLILRYGLHGDEPMTLAAAGKQLGYSGSYIYQIEVKALRKLRSPKNPKSHELWGAFYS